MYLNLSDAKKLIVFQESKNYLKISQECHVYNFNYTFISEKRKQILFDSLNVPDHGFKVKKYVNMPVFRASRDDKSMCMEYQMDKIDPICRKSVKLTKTFQNNYLPAHYLHLPTRIPMDNYNYILFYGRGSSSSIQ